MIAEKHLPSKTFRLALAPSIVNPRVNRLWLVPAGRMGQDSKQSDFVAIVDALRTLYAEASEHDQELRLHAFSEDGRKRFIKRHHYPLLGEAIVETTAQAEGPQTFDCVTFTDEPEGHLGYQRRLCRLIARAGALLPNRVRITLTKCECKTASSWFMAAIWNYSKIHHQPIWRRDPREEPRKSYFAGWTWVDPIAACLSAIEAMELVGPDPAKTTRMAGDWSKPMSKAEFARRVLQNPKARPRQVKDTFNNLEKQKEEGKNRWSFRLDNLDDSLRKKLERP